MKSISNIENQNSGLAAQKTELQRREEIIQSDKQLIEIISIKLSDRRKLTPELTPLFLEVLQGLSKAWHQSLIYNTPDGQVRSPENTIILLKPWITRILKMNILAEPNKLKSIEKIMPGCIRICAESFNDYAVAISEFKPVELNDLHQASELICLSRKLLDRKIYETNQRLIEKQIKSHLCDTE